MSLRFKGWNEHQMIRKRHTSVFIVALALVGFVVSNEISTPTVAQNSVGFFWQDSLFGLDPPVCIDARGQFCRWHNLSGWVGGHEPRTAFAPTHRISRPPGAWVWEPHPRAYCSAGDYTYSIKVVEGSLPPGMRWDRNRSTQQRMFWGIPEHVGFWYVRLQVYDVTCGGVRFDGFEQDVYINIHYM